MPHNGRFIDAAASWLSDSVHSWAPAESPSGPIKDWLGEELGRIDNLEFATQVDNAVPLDVSDRLLWANRVVSLGDEEWALAGARFRDRDLNRAFVDVIATSLPPDVSALPRLLDPETGPLEFFREFSPRCLRLYVADPHGFADEVNSSPGSVSAAVDMVIVAAPVDELQAAPRVSPYEDVGLVDHTPAVAAARVADIYEAILAKNPQLSWWAQPSDEQSLSEAHDDGLLYGVRWKGHDVGGYVWITPPGYSGM